MGLAAPAGCCRSLESLFRTDCRAATVAASVFLYFFNLSLPLSFVRRQSVAPWQRFGCAPATLALSCGNVGRCSLATLTAGSHSCRQSLVIGFRSAPLHTAGSASMVT